MKIEYALPGFRARGPRTGVIPPPGVERARPPRVTCLLALAHRFEALVRSGEVKDYADLARVGRVSRARVSQILKLLTLAPSIQEHILWLPPRVGAKRALQNAICATSSASHAGIASGSCLRASFAAIVEPS